MSFLDFVSTKKNIERKQKEFAERRLDSANIQGLLKHPGWDLFKKKFLDTEKEKADNIARKERNYEKREPSVALLEFFERMERWFEDRVEPIDEEMEKILKKVGVEWEVK